ncbi:MAG: alpha/beta hydrolase [Defluviicoccus sp.]|nr:alpha/beta hydrolase [Defluviicoccus sp.]
MMRRYSMVIRMLRYLTAAVVGYALLTGGLYLGQRRLLYSPDRAPPDLALAGLDGMEPAALATDDGLSLLAWYAPARGTGKATLVYFHGNAGHIGHRAGKVRPYLDAGHGVLLVSWRGYGGNDGSPTEDGLYRDGRAAFAFLDRLGVASETTVVYGESLGSGVAVQMARERRVAGVVLESPYTSIPSVAAHHYWYLPAAWLVRDRFDSLSKIGGIGAPLLVLHGERDRVVPVEFGRELFAAAREPKTWRGFAQAGHDLYASGAADAVLAFLSEAIGLPTEPL